ncbi:serine/threonine-protein kinase TNNI3K-like [Zootermopsis nevadensis]|uniref:serine/threonine-protein kinase TNNI3K-like n=1 Tax=Zootermopsis nevadensis TaxID=136037 RepID=UPI000B8EC483|nr:serine/threonine-protein kinase TNNI3K-like [Zootermopsis nevadensis]
MDCTTGVGSSQRCVSWPYSVVFCCKDDHHQQHFITEICEYAVTIQQQQRYFKFARLLLEHGADLNVQDNSGRIVLHIAAGHSGNSSILLKLFLHHRSVVNTRNIDSWTPLHEAAYNGSVECMEVLVGNGADVNAVTDDGVSVLHVAELQKHKDCVTWLLDIGADRNNAAHHRTLRNCPQMQHSANNSGCSGTRFFCAQIEVFTSAETSNLEMWKLLDAYHGSELVLICRSPSVAIILTTLLSMKLVKFMLSFTLLKRQRLGRSIKCTRGIFHGHISVVCIMLDLHYFVRLFHVLLAKDGLQLVVHRCSKVHCG